MKKIKLVGTMNEQKLMSMIQLHAQNTPGTNWEIMCKLRLNRQSRELDIVLGIPQLGIFILELKGWRNVGVTKEGKIYKTDGGVKKYVKDPYVQLAAEISAMSEFFRHQTEHRPTIFGAVIYSGISANSLNKLTSEVPNIFPSELSISLDSFLPITSNSDAGSDHLVEQIRKIAAVESSRHRRPHHKNDPETIATALRLLRHETEVDFLDQQLSDITNAVEQNTEYSIDLIQQPLEGLRRLQVTGPAGTGKTVLALSIAQKQTLQLGLPALYLCFSENLKNQIIERRSRSLADTVWIETPESLYHRLTGRHFAPLELDEVETSSLSDFGVVMPSDVVKEDRLYVCEDQIWIEILEHLEAQEILFAGVCIDEGQDFWGPLYQVLDEQTHENGTFAVFADENQTTRTRATFRQYDADRPGFHHVALRTNLRNPPAIAREITKEFSPAIEYQINNFVHSGTPPSKFNWLTDQELWRQLESVNTEIKKTLNKDVVILSDSLCKEKTAQMLTRAAQIFGWKACKIDEFKGLESDIVIAVVSLRDGVTSAIEALWKQRYVAFSRTRGLLYILQEGTQLSQLNATYKTKSNRNSVKHEQEQN